MIAPKEIWEEFKANRRTGFRANRSALLCLFFAVGVFCLVLSTFCEVLIADVRGEIISSRKIIVSQSAPVEYNTKYFTEYVIHSPDGADVTYKTWGRVLPRDLPTGTQIEKKRWHLNYRQNGQNIYYIHDNILALIILPLIVWALFNQGIIWWKPQRNRNS